jgi:hypothetical protein
LSGVYIKAKAGTNYGVASSWGNLRCDLEYVFLGTGKEVPLQGFRVDEPRIQGQEPKPLHGFRAKEVKPLQGFRI